MIKGNLGKIIFIVSSIFSSTIILNAETAWENLLDKEGIRVFHREAGGYPYGEFRSVTNIDASIETIYDILKDFTTYKDWYGYCLDSYLLEKHSPTFKTIYILTDAPWPFPDRYIIADVLFEQFNSRERIEIFYYITDRKYQLTKSRAEPVNFISGKCVMTMINENRTAVTFTLNIDPGGGVPKRFVKLFLQDQMYRTGKGLKEFSQTYIR
jgi:hypothetical protein